MTTPSPDSDLRPQLRERETSARAPEAQRSFAPANTDLPPPCAAFAAGRIDQARCGRILMVCPDQTEVGSHNWEPFAAWLVNEVAQANLLHGCLILDLRRVQKLSSRGLRSLAFAWRELADGGVIAICGLTPQLREIFAISQYDKLFELYDDAEAAYRSLAARARCGVA